MAKTPEISKYDTVSVTATINAQSVLGNGIRIVGGDNGGGTYSDRISKYDMSYWGPG